MMKGVVCCADYKALWVKWTVIVILGCVDDIDNMIGAQKISQLNN